MFKLLDRYIGKTIFNSTIIVLFILVTLSAIIKFIDQLRKTWQGSYTTLDASYYTLLSIPKDMEIFFPIAALLGVLLGLGILAQNNEVVVMQTSGFTHMHISLAVMKISIPLVLLSMAIGEFIAPHSEQKAHDYRTQQLYGSTLVEKQKGIWAKDGNNFIYIKYIKNVNEIKGINIYSFNDKRRLLSICYANTAIWNQNKKAWKLLEVNTSDLRNVRQITSSQNLSIAWKTSLTPDNISSMILNPYALSISKLYKYNKYLKQIGQESARYQLRMWNKLFQPLSVAVMMLMALSFIFGPLYNVSMSMRMLTGINCGFLFYVLDRILGPISLIYSLPPILGATLPSVIFLLISLLLLIKF